MAEITRDDIAGALAGVTVTWDGTAHQLAPTSAQPPALAAWQAWPDWQSAQWLTACVVERTWQVFVILPTADAQTWTSATDAVLNAVRAALLKVGHVSRAEPIALVAAEQSMTMPAVAFTLLTN